MALMAVLAAAAAPLAGVLGAVGVAAGALRFLAVMVMLRTGVAGVEMSPAPSPPVVIWRPRVAGSRRRSFLL